MRLVNRRAPILYESLTSLLERLRRANYYGEARWYRDLLPEPLPDNFDLLRPTTHYRILAELTGLSIDQLVTLTHHRFVPSFYSADTLSTLSREYDDLDVPMWGRAELEMYVQGMRSRKVCPLCYHENQALLLPWQLRHVTSCPVHNILLVNECPNCQRRLRVDFAAGTCAECGQRIDTLPTRSIANHSPSLQLMTLVWSAIGCSTETCPPPSLPLATDHLLNRIPPSTLLTFLWRGAKVLLAHDRHSPIFTTAGFPEAIVYLGRPNFMRIASMQHTNSVLVGMWRLLLHWPESWYVTLDRIVVKETGDRERFPVVLQENFTGDAWAWLHQSWMDYMEARMGKTDIVYPWLRYYRAASANEAPTWFSQREAARLLGINERTLKEYINDGTLGTTLGPLKEHKRHWRLVEGRSLDRCALERYSRMSLEGAAFYCNVSKEQMVALVAAGLMEAAHGPLVDGRSIWVFEFDALRRCLQAITGHLPVRPLPMLSPNGAWTLFRTHRVLTGVGINLTHMLLLVQQGVLPTYRMHEDGGFCHLWWEPSAVIETMKRLQRSGPEVPLSATAVSEQLGYKVATLRRLYAAGLLVPRYEMVRDDDVYWQYDEHDVDTFLERYVTSDGAADILGVTRLTVQNWSRAGRLQPVTGPEIDGSHAYRFDREVLITWRHERLTFGEAMELLGVSKATLDRWVKKGRLTPLEDMGGKQRWFGRREVEQLHIDTPPLAETGSDTL